MTTSGVAGTGTPPGRPSGLKGSTKDKDVIEEMLTRFSNAQSYESENRENYIRDTEFSASNDQWDENVKVLRGKHRPALTFNRLNGIVKQIIGDYRQNKLAIKAIPAGSGADEEKADLWGGIIRGVELDSNADMVYVNGLECSVRGGFGWWRIVPEFEHEESFNQKLMIRAIHNPLTVYCDPAARLIDRSDARWIIVTEKMPIEEFKAAYPDADTTITDSLDSDLTDDWGDDDELRVAEYFCKEKVSVRLAAFDNGAVVEIDDDSEIQALESIGWKLTKERKSERTQVRWRKCTANEVLEERLYKTQYIPIVPTLGEEVNLQGKVHLRSTIYYARDAQKQSNYMKTAAVESVALMSKAPWMGTAKHFEGYEDIWDRANVTPVTKLIYNVDPEAPQGPTRIEPPTQPIGELALANQNNQDIQYTTGVFDASLGQKSNAISGVAESERQGQTATNTYIPVDNLRKAIEYTGRVIIDWYPEFLDTERVIRTVDMEGDTDMQTINEQKQNPLLGVTEILNDITVGQFDVVVETGPSFASRRREAVSGMMDFAKAFPQQSMYIADLVAKNMDIPGNNVMADRLKRTLPPNITTDPDSPEGQQAAQQAKQQQAQQQQMQQQALQQHQQQEAAKTQAEVTKSQATVIKSQAEVIKAKIDAVSAISDNINQSEQVKAAEEMDVQRLGQAQPMVGNSQGNQAMPQQPAQPPVDNTPIVNGLGQIAQLIAESHHANAAQTGHTHELLGHLVHGHQALNQNMQNMMAEQHNGNTAMMGNALATLAKVHAAPTEAIRDKTGRMVGSRKVLDHATV